MQSQASVNIGMIVRLLGVVFVGLHIPLAAVAYARLGLSVTDPTGLVGAAFAGTLIAAFGTLGSMWWMLSSVRQGRARL